MRRLFLDTNVVLDIILDRTPNTASATRVLESVVSGDRTGLISSTSLTTVWYITQRHQNRRRAEVAVRRMVELLEIAAVARSEIEVALQDVASRTFTDFEDALQHAAAETAGVNVIVTRNATDFKGARLEVVTPAELTARL